MSLSEAVKEVVYLRQIIEEIEPNLTVTPTKIFEDNKATRDIARKPGTYTKLRHVRIRHFFVQDKQSSGEVTVEDIDSANQAADLLTKLIDGSEFAVKSAQLGVSQDVETRTKVRIDSSIPSALKSC